MTRKQSGDAANHKDDECLGHMRVWLCSIFWDVRYHKVHNPAEMIRGVGVSLVCHEGCSSDARAPWFRGQVVATTTDLTVRKGVCHDVPVDYTVGCVAV
jgi:hypothetical protein